MRWINFYVIDVCRVGHVKIKTLFIDNITQYQLNVGLISLHSDASKHINK